MNRIDSDCFFVKALFNFSGAILKVSSLTSQKTGLPPSQDTASAVEIQVLQGITTSSLWLKFSALRASIRASVPLPQLIQYLLPIVFLKLVSKSETSFPRINADSSTTLFIAMSISGLSAKYCLPRSTNFTLCWVINYNFRIFRAGLPAYIPLVTISFVTTLPAPITEPSQILTEGWSNLSQSRHCLL